MILNIIFVPIQTPHDEKYEGITRIPKERADFNYEYLIKGMKDLSNEIEKLIEERNNARNNNDYEKADKIRDKLSEMNVKINDVNGKTEWEIL